MGVSCRAEVLRGGVVGYPVWVVLESSIVGSSGMVGRGVVGFVLFIMASPAAERISGGVLGLRNIEKVRVCGFCFGCDVLWMISWTAGIHLSYL